MVVIRINRGIKPSCDNHLNCCKYSDLITINFLNFFTTSFCVCALSFLTNKVAYKEKRNCNAALEL